MKVSTTPTIIATLLGASQMMMTEACNYGYNYYTGYYYYYDRCDGVSCYSSSMCSGGFCNDGYCSATMPGWAIFLVTFFSVFCCLSVVGGIIKKRRAHTVVIRNQHHHHRVDAPVESTRLIVSTTNVNVGQPIP